MKQTPNAEHPMQNAEFRGHPASSIQDPASDDRITDNESEMNMEPNISNPGSPTPAPALPNESQTRIATRPLYWSVLRELWENKSIYIAPAIVAAVLLVGALVSSGYLPERRRNAMLLDEVRRRAAIELPYNIVAMMLIVTAFIIGFFYCLDALYGERRDRSILFWKSLPVSDLTTVLSKAIIPLAILPAIIFVVVVATQFFMLLISSAVLMPSGLAGTTWANFNLLRRIGGLVLRPDRHRALARANLRMGLVDFRTRAARNIPLGRFAAARDRHF